MWWCHNTDNDTVINISSRSSGSSSSSISSSRSSTELINIGNNAETVLFLIGSPSNLSK